MGSGAFHDLSLPIVVPGTDEGTTNYVHTNGADGQHKILSREIGTMKNRPKFLKDLNRAFHA